MGFSLDIHVHTRRHSDCSLIPAEVLISKAVAAGLQGLIITEHHYQWPEEELQELLRLANENVFLLLAGFEYSSAEGDILVYGLPPAAANAIGPFAPPTEALAEFKRRGAVCVAAHPTRAGMGFSEDIMTMPFDAFEIQSTNLKPHEQRMAAKLAEGLKRKAVAASDAHRPDDIGRYAIEFDEPLHSMADFMRLLRQGAGRPIGPRF